MEKLSHEPVTPGHKEVGCLREIDPVLARLPVCVYLVGGAYGPCIRTAPTSGTVIKCHSLHQYYLATEGVD